MISDLVTQVHAGDPAPSCGVQACDAGAFYKRHPRQRLHSGSNLALQEWPAGDQAWHATVGLPQPVTARQPATVPQHVSHTGAGLRSLGNETGE